MPQEFHGMYIAQSADLYIYIILLSISELFAFIFWGNCIHDPVYSALLTFVSVICFDLGYNL